MRSHETEVNTEALVDRATRELKEEGILFVDTEIRLSLIGIDPVAFAEEILNNG
jgi:hypothetical protein